jgi:hypothetical protein
MRRYIQATFEHVSQLNRAYSKRAGKRIAGGGRRAGRQVNSRNVFLIPALQAAEQPGRTLHQDEVLGRIPPCLDTAVGASMQLPGLSGYIGLLLRLHRFEQAQIQR